MNKTRTTLTVVTKDEVYHYSKENEIEFIKKQMDGRPWIRLPKQVMDTEFIPENVDFSDKVYEVTYQQSKLIPSSRIIELNQTDKIVELRLKEE